MGFTDQQNKALSAKLHAKHVHQRTKNGVTLSYIEGWHAISEANRIFGFDAWDRETVDCQCVWEKKTNDSSACAYMARVRITVRAGENVICREGTGFGNGHGKIFGDAHEAAFKQAETDAMKRALVTFGNPFGLALYDTEQTGVRGQKSCRTKWKGTINLGDVSSPEVYDQTSHYFSRLRELVDKFTKPADLEAFWNVNSPSVLNLTSSRPDLVNDRGVHHSRILSTLVEKKLTELSETTDTEVKEAGFSIGREDRILAEDRTNILSPQSSVPEASIKTNFRPRSRIRDLDHLRYVRRQDCLICGRNPSQAHHIKFAEPRAMSRKVGDQWTVPLCASHHRQLHAAGNEEKWWNHFNVDPLTNAEKLWKERLSTTETTFLAERQ